MDLTTATTKAYAMISNAVDRQAYYLSYLDTFRLITIFFIIVIPLVVFLKTKKKCPKIRLRLAPQLLKPIRTIQK